MQRPLAHSARLLLLLASVLAPASACAQASGFRWPNGARAAVSLAYDDALDSQLDHALPALDRHGLKGSFYLQLSNPAVARRMGEWRAAARRGHELGNHSLFHQCSGSGADRAWVEPHRNLDTTTPEQMRDQVLLGNTMLEAIDGRRERTYTAPCGDMLASADEGPQAPPRSDGSRWGPDQAQVEAAADAAIAAYETFTAPE